MDDLAVVLEHVHLLDGRDVRHTDPLEGRCELLVICGERSERKKQNKKQGSRFELQVVS